MTCSGFAFSNHRGRGEEPTLAAHYRRSRAIDLVSTREAMLRARNGSAPLSVESVAPLGIELREA